MVPFPSTVQLALSEEKLTQMFSSRPSTKLLRSPTERATASAALSLEPLDLSAKRWAGK